MTRKIPSQSLIALMSLRGFGKKTVLKLFREFYANGIYVGSPGALLSAVEIFAEKTPRVRVPLLSELVDAYDQANLIIEKSVAENIQCISLFDENYPSRLKKIPDPPLVLFAKGNVEALSHDVAVAVIGTREPSDYGLKAAFNIGALLPKFGASVVSGLALGCDTQSQFGCLSEAGLAVGVLAHGLDTIQPVASKPLAQKILDNEGCLVSEHTIGTAPRRGSFVERDRIQSGLSDAILVIETGIKGGSMHTVKFCEEQRRRVACMLHPPEHAGHKMAEGCAMLINSERAIPIANQEDLLHFLGNLTSKEHQNYESEFQQLPTQGSFEF